MLDSYIMNQGARWAYEKEIENTSSVIEINKIAELLNEVVLTKNTAEIKNRINKYLSSGGVPLLYKNEKLYVANSDMHSFIVGSTGSMKTRRIVMIMLITLILNGESVVINDPKGELYRLVKPLIRIVGCSEFVLNYREPYKGSRYNYLQIAYEFYHNNNKDKAIVVIKDLAESIYSKLSNKTDDAFWASIASKYFCGLALILIEEGTKQQCTLENICRLDTQINQRMNSFRLSQYFMLSNNSSLAYQNLSGTINAPNDTKSSILAIFRDGLTEFVFQEGINDMMLESDINLESIGEKQSLLFLITPDERTTFNPLISAFVNQCYQILIDCAETKYKGVLPVRVNFVIDEFGNLPKIPDMNQKLTSSRSRQIRFNIVSQSISQIYSVYGKESTENLIGNCDVWMYLNSKDMLLLDKLSYLCGKKYQKSTDTYKNLIEVSELQRLSKGIGETLIMYERNYPIVSNLPDISEYGFCFFNNEDSVNFSERNKMQRSEFNFTDIASNMSEIVDSKLNEESEEKINVFEIELMDINEGNEEDSFETNNERMKRVIEALDKKITEMEESEEMERESKATNSTVKTDTDTQE